METLLSPAEIDFKGWIKDAVKEYIQEYLQHASSNENDDEGLFNRKEIAKFLHISLVILNDWIRRGLPSHPQRGRIYFDKKKFWIILRRKNAAA